MLEIKQNFNLKQYNSFGFNVKSRWFLEYHSEEEIKTLLQDEFFLEANKVHVGRGTNLLFLDHIDGIVYHSKIKGFEIVREDTEHVELRVGSGELWDDVVAFAVSHNWGGIENLSLIPGEIGAAAVQNIGAYGREMADVLMKVEAFDMSDGQKKEFSKDECQYAYRNSYFKHEGAERYIISYVTIKLDKNPFFHTEYGSVAERLAQYPEITLSRIREVICAIRREKLPDPDVLGNAGSFFMNPMISNDYFLELKKDYPNIPFYTLQNDLIKIPAAWLIDQCGFKGKRYDNVGVYEKQPLVLVNFGEGTGHEIAMLAASIMERVKQKFGIELQPEVKYI